MNQQKDQAGAPDILLIEDNDADAEIVSSIYKKHNIRATILRLENGELALNYFRQIEYSSRREANPKFVLLDLNLPKIDGFEVLRKMRADPRTKNIPVFVFTSSHADSALFEAGKLGATSYIRKQITYEELEKAIMKTIRYLDTHLITRTHPSYLDSDSLEGQTSLPMELNTNRWHRHLIRMEKSNSKMHSLLEALGEIELISNKTLNYDTIHMRDLVSEMLRSLQRFYPGREVNFQLMIRPEIAFVSDRVVLNILLWNVLHNTIQFRSPERKPIVRIRAFFKENCMCIEIADNGMGIPSQFHTRVFDMFFKADDSSPGSGLGLYVVRIGTDKLKGKVSLISETKKGSVLQFQFLSSDLPVAK
jgi:CheY-like chemotaxis protein